MSAAHTPHVKLRPRTKNGLYGGGAAETHRTLRATHSHANTSLKGSASLAVLPDPCDSVAWSGWERGGSRHEGKGPPIRRAPQQQSGLWCRHRKMVPE